MTEQEFKDLDVGDVVRHRSGIHGYAVMNNYGDHVVIVRTFDIRNPEEWNLVSKVTERMGEDSLN